ncbi:MAG: hypothetical protein Q7N50_05910, partial [Armatimonadota bacterium]|nr:hypothetical protein [Armatimonadota bacterium]
FDWNAARWRISHKFPRKWGDSDHVEVIGNPDKPIKVEVTVDTNDPMHMAKLIAAFADVKLLPAELIEHLGEEEEPQV